MRAGTFGLVLSLTVSLLACGPTEPAPRPETTRQDIVGGTADTGDPNVVMILLESSPTPDPNSTFALCTGTLISPRIVLTAAHCVAPDSGASSWQVYFGTTILESDPGYLGLRDVTATTYHPLWNPSNIGAGNDIALLKMQYPAPSGVSPKPINRTPLSNSNLGQAVRLVGFGDTAGGAGDGGRKMQVTSSLAGANYNLMYFGSSSANTCQGDSGGPNFMTIGGTEVVAGITSFGDPGCDEYGAGTRVDRFASSFIDPWVEANDVVTCAGDGGCASGCPSPDPDCPCNGDGYCTSACGNPDLDPDCPSGCGTNGTCVASGCPIPDPDCNTEPNPCGADGACAADCVVRDPDCPLSGVGGPCGTGGDCESGLCIPADDEPEITYCSGSCDPAAPSCPGGMACVPTSGGSHICVYETPTPGAVGSPCSTPNQCLSGLCVPGDSGNFCSAYCDPAGAACRSGFDCVPTTGEEHICVPGPEEKDSKKGPLGCAAAPGSAPPATAALLPLCALLFLLRRRRG